MPPIRAGDAQEANHDTVIVANQIMAKVWTKVDYEMRPKPA